MRPRRAEQPVDQQGADHDRHEHQRHDPQGKPPAVVLAIDRDDRQHEEIGEHERDHPGEGDAAGPKHRGERHVADRAHEAEDRDQRADEDVLEEPQRFGGAHDEQAVEEIIAEQSHEPGQQEADQDLSVDHRPVAAEVLGDVRPGLGGGEPEAQWHAIAGRGVLMARVRLARVLARTDLDAG